VTREPVDHFIVAGKMHAWLKRRWFDIVLFLEASVPNKEERQH
jgi:hypothetical protein